MRYCRAFCGLWRVFLCAGPSCQRTPDPFVFQVTSSPAGFYSLVGDISANGRFVVFQSNGDVATEKIPSKNPDGTLNPNARNNEDGNREIFLLDYAQRRIFQLTNTKNIQKENLAIAVFIVPRV